MTNMFGFFALKKLGPSPAMTSHYINCTLSWTCVQSALPQLLSGSAPQNLCVDTWDGTNKENDICAWTPNKINGPREDGEDGGT